MNLREFGQLVLVYPEVHIWTGTVTVDPDEDLKAVKDQLPPASLVSSGSKRLIDPERLTPLKSARKRLERAIEDVSVPVQGSRGVPQSKLSELHAEIEQHVGEILSLKQALIANLDVGVNLKLRSTVVSAKGANVLRVTASARTPGGSPLDGTYEVRLGWSRYIPDGMLPIERSSRAIGTVEVRSGTGTVDIPLTPATVRGTPVPDSLDHGNCCSLRLRTEDGVNSVFNAAGGLQPSSTMQWLDRMNGQALGSWVYELDGIQLIERQGTAAGYQTLLLVSPTLAACSQSRRPAGRAAPWPSHLGPSATVYFLRYNGWDSFILSPDVTKALIREKVVAKAPTSKADMKAVQAAFNTWTSESGLPQRDVSRILSFSVGPSA